MQENVVAFFKETIMPILKELIIPTVTCLISGMISYVVSVRTANRWVPTYRKAYEELRISVSEALTMFANLYTNPVDIAKTENHQLPPNYESASLKLRELASKLRAFSETMPSKIKGIPSKQELSDASRCLIGLSNSFTTPYNSSVPDTHFRNIEQYESELRKLLHLPPARG